MQTQDHLWLAKGQKQPRMPWEGNTRKYHTWSLTPSKTYTPGCSGVSSLSSSPTRCVQRHQGGSVCPAGPPLPTLCDLNSDGSLYPLPPLHSLPSLPSLYRCSSNGSLTSPSGSSSSSWGSSFPEPWAGVAVEPVPLTRSGYPWFPKAVGGWWGRWCQGVPARALEIHRGSSGKMSCSSRGWCGLPHFPGSRTHTGSSGDPGRTGGGRTSGEAGTTRSC